MLFHILCCIILIFVSWWLWLVAVDKLSYVDAFDSIHLTCRNVWRNFNEYYRIYQQRQSIYLINQNIAPFEEAVKKRNVCKYFKLYGARSYSRDVTLLGFKVHGIANEYKDNPTDLKPLLESLLQDFYIERLGNLSFPAVYVQHVQEGEATFLVANNAYGNERIGQIREADRLKGAPNMDELEDE